MDTQIVQAIGKADSIEAYESVKPFLTELRLLVLNTVNALGNNATYKEVVQVLNINNNTVSARLGELKREGYLEPLPEKRLGCRAVCLSEKGKSVIS